MAVVTRKRTRGITYYVKFEFDGREVWEHAGRDKEEARRLNRRRLREVSEGSYRASRKSERQTVRQFAEDWLAGRTGRNSHNEEVSFRTFVLGRAWFAGLRIEELEPRHMKQLVDELKVAWSERFQRTISGKTATNIYGTVVTMCRDARIAGVLKTQPCVLPKGSLKRKSTVRRAPYSLEAVAKILRCPDVHPTARVFCALAFLTGMREGEVCGRRWRTLDRAAYPLWCLTVDTQYEDQPLKGDVHEAGEVARKVPVHPALAKLLDWWWSSGFELVHLRRPTLDDFIAPNENIECFSRSAAYAMFQRALARAGVSNLTLHSTRHTFISLARRGGARKELVEKITHNASGDTVDQYTHWDWAPLCEAVLCLKLETSEALSQGPSGQPGAFPPLLPGGGSDEPGTLTGDAGGDVSGNVRRPFLDPLTGDVSGDVRAHSSRIIVAPPGFEPRPPHAPTANSHESPWNGDRADSPVKAEEVGVQAAERAARHQQFRRLVQPALIERCSAVPPALLALAYIGAGAP